MGIIVYRVQDGDGRGPWRPGFSHKWVETRPDHDNLPSWLCEFGPAHLKAFSWEHCGSGCRTIEQLCRWFTESEYKTLLKGGYQAVEMEASRILVESNIQCLFTRKNPLCDGAKIIKLYDCG